MGLLYKGLATGRASLVAPLTAVVGAVVPVTWGLITGERPSAMVYAHSQFVAGFTNYEVYLSADGTTWTACVGTRESYE